MVGTPLYVAPEQALGEVDFCSAIYDYYATEATSLLADETIALSDGEGSAFIRRNHSSKGS